MKLIFLTDSSFDASVLFPPRFSGGICTVSTLQRYKLGRNSITKAMIKILRFILQVYKDFAYFFIILRSKLASFIELLSDDREFDKWRSFSESDKENMREKAREMFYHGYDSYMKECLRYLF